MKKSAISSKNNKGVSSSAQAALKLRRGLVAIATVTPSLLAGAHGEQGTTRLVQIFLQAHGIDAPLEGAAPNRPNVVTTTPAEAKSGRKSKYASPALMNAPHID